MLVSFVCRLSFHYSLVQDQKEKQVFYKIKSAQKVLPLGYFDDMYGYLESAVALTPSFDDLVTIRNLLEVANFTMAVNGPRSLREHRRPSLTSIDLNFGCCSSDATPLATPRTEAVLAELPNRFQSLSQKVLIMIGAAENESLAQ